MAILENRFRDRGQLRHILLLPFYLLKKILPFSLLLFSLLLLLNFSWVQIYIAKPIGRLCLNTTGNLVDYGNYLAGRVISPVVSWHKYYLNTNEIKIENINLSLHNAELTKKLKSLEEVKQENADLKALLHIYTPNKHSIGGRVINVSSSPMHNSCIIDLGKNKGVKVDNIVKFNGGLFGKVARVSDDYSEVVMIQDPSCRVPVVTMHSKENGILARLGDKMMMIYLPENHHIITGEELYTSGQGRIFPKGIKVGEVLSRNGDEVIVDIPKLSGHQQFVIVELD